MNQEEERAALEEALRALEDQCRRPHAIMADFLAVDRQIDKAFGVLRSKSPGAADAWLEAGCSLQSGPVRMHPDFFELFSSLARAQLEYIFAIRAIMAERAKVRSFVSDTRTQTRANEGEILTALAALADLKSVVTEAEVVKLTGGSLKFQMPGCDVYAKRSFAASSLS